MGGLSSFAERARNPELTRAEMEALTAEQDAVYEAMKAELERLQAENRDAKNGLSHGGEPLGSGPLLPEDGDLCPTRKRRPRSGEEGCSHAERGNKVARREFLRGETQG